MAEHHDSGVGTTGHQWDDDEGCPLREYNNPLPRWWLYSFYATIVFSLVYWVLYPAWPLLESSTQGVLGWSMHGQFQAEMAEVKALQKPLDEKLAATPLGDVPRDAKLLAYAKSGGKAVFGDYCAPCHGQGGVGASGFPALVDDDWLFGGSLETLVETIANGRGGMMPAHLDAAGGVFKAEQVSELAAYVLSLSGGKEEAEAVKRGNALFHGDAACHACHGEEGKGSLLSGLEPSLGAPNLTDAVWLFRGNRETVTETIARGRTGHMPAWAEGTTGANRKLDALTIKKLAIYVHSLGGGK